MIAWLLANTADEGSHVILGMLVVGLSSSLVIALGERCTRTTLPATAASTASYLD